MRANFAAVLTGSRSVTIDAQTVPENGASDVHGRLEGGGVGGSNLLVREGRPGLQYPLMAGAERRG